MSELNEVGHRRPQAEAESKVRGAAVYTHDVTLPGMLFGAVLRSPHAHARVVSIDTSRAATLAGVRAVITAADFDGRRYQHLGGSYSDRHPLARDRVRFWGEEVAAVAATTLEAARAACALISVEYEPLPALVTPEQALAQEAPDIHGRSTAGDKNTAIHFSCDYGETDQALAATAFVLEDEFEHGIVAPCCMETNGTVARYDAGTGRLELWTATQAPFFIRKEVAHLLDFEPERIRIHSVQVGGGFGGKSKICEQEVLAALLAVKTSGSVKITLDRHEEFVSGKTDHAKKIRIKTAVGADGAILHRATSVQIDNGAYTAYAPTYVGAARQRTTCLYRVKSAHYDCQLVYTNKVPGGQYRGMGAPHVIWAIESHMDQIAERLKLDPLDYRLAQANRSGDVTPLGWRISTCGLSDCLTEAGRLIGWGEKRGKLPPGRGVGVAAMIHPSGGVIYQEGNYANTRIELTASGLIVVHTQTADSGTWQNTTLAQLAAEALGVRTEDVFVSHMDTDQAPPDLGSAASRVTFVTGNATVRAAGLLAEQIKHTLAPRWNCAPADIVIAAGRARHLGDPERTADLAEIFALCGPLTADGHFSTPGERPDPVTGQGNYAATYVFGAQAAEVEVDRATGRIRILKMAVAQDVGRALNPTAVEGQIYGGVLQGIGMALQEELVFEEGRPVNASFLDYRVPRIGDAPPIDIALVETKDPLGPYGAKAGAEPTINATIAAIANAVADATGIRFHSLPMTPDKVLAALEGRDRRTTQLKAWKRPYNAEIATVRALYPAAVFPMLREVGTRYAHVPERNVKPELVVATSVDEAVAELTTWGRRARIIAGGTDMLVGLRQGIYDPECLIDIARLPDLRVVELGDDRSTLRIGAATALEDIACSEIVQREFPVLTACISQIATPQVRRAATIAGDLCQEKRCWFFRSAFPCYKLGGPTCPCFAVLGDNRHHSIMGAKRCAAPCPADLAPMLTALDASVVIAGPRGIRRLGMEDLYAWSGLTRLEPGEMILRIDIPIVRGATCAFEKFALRQGDFAEASASVRLLWDRGRIREARIALGAVSPLPQRARKAERMIEDIREPEHVLRRAAESAIEGSLPLKHNAHKAVLITNLVEKALFSSLSRK